MILIFDPEDNFERVLKAFCLAWVVIFSVLFVLSFGLLLVQGWWLVLPTIAVFGSLFIIIYGSMSPETRDKRNCVMCNLALKDEDESRHWVGAHEWCETYY